jgi:hypothetical protein
MELKERYSDNDGGFLDDSHRIHSMELKAALTNVYEYSKMAARIHSMELKVNTALAVSMLGGGIHSMELKEEPMDLDMPDTTVARLVDTPVTAEPVEAETLAVTVVPEVKVNPVTKLPYDGVIPVTALAVKAETLATTVVPALTVIPVTKELVDVETPVTAEAVDVVTPTTTVLPVKARPVKAYHVDFDTPVTNDAVETP